MSQHQMTTRSKKVSMNINNNNNDDPPPQEDYEDNIDGDNIDGDDIDEHGNIKDLIDYSYGQKKKISKKKKKITILTNKNKGNSNTLKELTLSYMLMNIMNNNNLINLKDKSSPIINIDLDISDIKSNNKDDNESPDLEMNEDTTDTSINEENDEDEDDESASEYDELDENFMEIEENLEFDEDENINYFHKLDKDKKEILLKEINKINEINGLNMPLKFKILNSDMNLNTKAIAIRNIEKLNEMDSSTGEYAKMDKWINGLISIPFNKYVSLPVNNENTIEDKRKFIVNTKSILDKSIYGHEDAKTHILQVIGKWIKNPMSQGNVLAIQGPMGNGKTTLVKEGISKAINRPFEFIALGGQSDSSLFEGHSYTYEGSHWGRIIDILINSKCMNPVIYFDELDKVSESYKGEEIIHMLTHLTDPSQNSLFQDNYYPGINIDLSKVLFIFSFNDESKVNRILKDRMYVINTKGFNTKDKIKISKKYILPELYDTYLFNQEEILINDNILQYIIEKYTNKEEGVRNLKRCIESIISKINIYYLTNDSDIELNFKIKDFKLPYTITTDDIDNLLKLNNNNGQPPMHMYM
jgi:ATP-dependent Lon protease